MNQRQVRPVLAGVLAVLLLQACGGGGGSDSGAPVFGGDGGGFGQTLQPSTSYQQQCAPNNTEAESWRRTASLATEKNWIRSYLDEAYLWRDQVPAVDAGAFAYSGGNVEVALSAYFDALLTPQRTGSGAFRDRFSFMMSTREWNALSGSGVETGYGIEWHMAQATPPRQLRVAYVEPGSPAATAGVQRGDTLVSVDSAGADAADASGVALLNAGLYPGANGETHRFVFTAVSGAVRTLPLTSSAVTKTPVPTRQVMTASDGAKVGYLLFNDHISTSEAPLIAAMQDFRNQGIRDLVLDLRYNGGGYLFIASELSTMIAGSAATSGKVFEQLRYNSRRQADNNSENARTPFYANSCVLVNNRCTSEQPLPQLNLRRIYILAQKGTCSASEAIINGLRGVDVEVVLIGGTTCGKPYGFTAKDNCGYSYFPIEFEGTNAKGFGDYSDGFVPGGSGSTGVKGCAVADDFSRALGDTSERMLATALAHRLTGQCPAQPAGAEGGAVARVQSAAGGDAVALHLKRLAARGNRIAGGRP